MATLPQHMSLEAFLELPEKKPALEYDDGMVTKKVTPKGQHAALQIGIGEIINRIARPQQLARAFTELRATYANLSRVPDVAVYRWERIPRDVNGKIADDFWEPPDIAIEIISPGQRVNAMVRRCLTYLGNGVTIVLLVDPSDESVLVFRRDQIPLTCHGSDKIDLGDVIPGFQISAQEIFAELFL